MPNKHVMHDKFHITISPKSGDATQETLETILNNIVKKDVEKYCYVFEHGKQGNHLHLHLLIKTVKNKRQDTVKLSVVNKCKKYIPITAYLVLVKTAWNPAYLITDYMHKEGEFINHGFDLANLKKELKNIRGEIYQLDSQLIPITRDSFGRLYEELKQDIKTKYSLHNINDHINEFLLILKNKGYRYQSFYFWNRTQCNNIVRHLNDDFCPVDNLLI